MKTLIKGRVRKLINEHFEGVGYITSIIHTWVETVNVVRVRSYKLNEKDYIVEFDINVNVENIPSYFSDASIIRTTKDIFFGLDIKKVLRPHLERFFPSSCCSVEIVIKDVKVLRK
jgi:hypothetical protein